MSTKIAKKPATRKYARRPVLANPQQVASYSTRKAYKKNFKEISMETDRLIDQVLNPEDSNDIVRWPNTYGLSSVYKCKTVFNARFDEEGRCCVVVAPTIKDCIFTTYGEVTTTALSKYGSSSVGSGAPFSFQNVILDEQDQSFDWTAPIICNNGQALLPFPNSGLGKMLYPIEFLAQGTLPDVINTVLYFRFPNAIAQQAGVQIYLYDSGMSLLHQNATYLTNHTTEPEGYGVNINLGNQTGFINSISYMAIRLWGTVLPYRGPVYMWMNSQIPNPNNNPVSVDLVMPNHAQHVGIYDIKDAKHIQESCNQAFILGQSLLLTSEMSDINNGGMLSIARIPAASPVGIDSAYSFSSIKSNNWYEWLSGLANNSYDGPVKDGGYSFYLPEDETGYFYRPVDNYFSKELPYLVSEFTVQPGLSDAAIVRIKVASIVQFTTTSSIYDQRPSCHVDDIEFVHHILSLVPASYSNDGHKEGLKKALKLVGNKVRILLKDPKTYATAAKLLATIAPLVL